MVLKVAQQLKQIRRDDFDYEVLMEAQLNGAQYLDQIERMTRRNSDAQPMDSLCLDSCASCTALRNA